MSEIATYITARQFCEKHGVATDTARMRYAKLLESKPELFNSPWRIDAPLSGEQVQALVQAGERIGGGAKNGFQKKEPVHGSQKTEVVRAAKKDATWIEVAALVVAFLLPTIASMTNTYKVSHYLSNDATTSLCIMLVISATPLLFMVGKVSWEVYFTVGVAVILVESFFNLSAIYIALMGGMTYIFGQPTGYCSPFLDTVCKVTNSGQQQTAIGLGLVVSICIAAVQLTSFYELKKRI